MTVDDYYTYAAGVLTFTRENASTFAKEIAGDFNPIHDPQARRFCVPGDLLFAVVLDLHHARGRMDFEFEQMVDDKVRLGIEVQDSGLRLTDSNGKLFLDVAYSGDKVESAAANSALVEAYVKFSGKTFPFLLVELMQKNHVMINPQRPLVIYRKMSLKLHDTTCENFQLAFTDSNLQVDGKKGEVALNFDILCNDKVVGSGTKNMLLGGLREYQQSVIDELVEEYNTIKSHYLSDSA